MANITAIKDKIENLQKPYQIQILRILKNRNIDINENRNGIFFNLAKIDNNTFNEIEKYLSYVEKQIDFLNEHEKTKELYKENYFKNNEYDNTLESSIN